MLDLDDPREVERFAENVELFQRAVHRILNDLIGWTGWRFMTELQIRNMMLGIEDRDDTQ